MSEYPELSYKQIISALQRLGFIVIRQKGSHIRLQKRVLDKIIKITVPAHKPVNPNTLRQLLKQSGIDIQTFKDNL
ncbi:MAG: type II toxin-antitoxin system HicA family toxin [Ignavibacteriae bacterium]|nr:type II toxin-antitoxin system HicA family toxin [Ignavibacteriota bacterium]